MKKKYKILGNHILSEIIIHVKALATFAVIMIIAMNIATLYQVSNEKIYIFIIANYLLIKHFRRSKQKKQRWR